MMNTTQIPVRSATSYAGRRQAVGSALRFLKQQKLRFAGALGDDSQKRFFASSTARNDDGDNHNDSQRNTATTTASSENGNIVVYESPFGTLVTKLRVVSLMTGVFGSIGLPLATAMSSSITPSTGFVALCVTFGTGTIGTTLAIQYVFGPYVYSIERIPIRKCHYKKKETTAACQPNNDGTSTNGALTNGKEAPENCTNTAPSNSVDDATCISTTTAGPQHYLYMAKSKSIFIRPVETVFDAHNDVQKYTGFTLPLCNFTAKGRPLYMHTEYLRDDKLYSRMLAIENDGKTKYKAPPKENPDDDFL
jgi:hypothetical protein